MCPYADIIDIAAVILLLPVRQWCVAKNGGGYMQRGVVKGLKVPCLFMITEVSIRCQKNPEVGIRRIPAYTPQYTTAVRPHLSVCQAQLPVKKLFPQSRVTGAYFVGLWLCVLVNFMHNASCKVGLRLSLHMQLHIQST